MSLGKDGCVENARGARFVVKYFMNEAGAALNI